MLGGYVMEKRIVEGEGIPEPSVDFLLIEYQAAQDSAQHHDTLIWSITSVVWGASLLMLVFLLGQTPNPSFKYIVAFLSVLGILLNIMVWKYTYQLSKVKIHKYDRCKAIEKQLGLKQHTTLQYPAGRYKKWYSIVMVLFILLWIVVAYSFVFKKGGVP
jgi:VanZ family protein